MHFYWKKCKRKSLFIESEEIVHWRRDYLRKVRKVQSEGKIIRYLDGTWINEGYTVKKLWQGGNIKNISFPKDSVKRELLELRLNKL